MHREWRGKAKERGRRRKNGRQSSWRHTMLPMEYNEPAYAEAEKRLADTVLSRFFCT
jgi:hypothetical protein